MCVHICYTNTSYCSACFCQLPVHQIAFSVAVEFPSSAHAPLEAHGLAGSPGDFPPDLRPRPPPTAPGDAACGKSCLWKWPCLAVLIGWCKNAFPRRGAVLCQVVLPAAKMEEGEEGQRAKQLGLHINKLQGCFSSTLSWRGEAGRLLCQGLLLCSV